jgi:hypothetical protein
MTDQDKVMVKNDFGFRDFITNIPHKGGHKQGDKAGF